MCGECVYDTPTCREDAERGKRLYAAFLDLEKAYDTVGRAGLWEALTQYGVKGRILESCTRIVKLQKVGEEITDWFEVQKGVRQGCPMSPLLFNIYLDRVMKETLPLFKGELQLEQLPDTGNYVCRRHCVTGRE